MSKYADKVKRRLEEAAREEAAARRDAVAERQGKPTDRRGELVAVAVRRLADAVAALAEAHAIVKSLRKDAKGEEAAVFYHVFQVSGAAWTRSCGALAKLAKLTDLDSPTAGQGGNQKPQRLETEALRTTADRCADKGSIQ